MGDTSGTELTVDNVAPCTEFLFAVSAVLGVAGAAAETSRSVSAPVRSPLDESDPFEVPNLSVHNGDRAAELEWDHAGCVAGYSVRVCPGGERREEEGCRCARGEKKKKSVESARYQSGTVLPGFSDNKMPNDGRFVILLNKFQNS